MRWLFSLLLLGAIAYGLYFYWGAEDRLSSYLTEQLGTQATVRGVGLSLSPLPLKGVSLSDTQGIQAFRAQTLSLKNDWASYLKRTIHLEELKIDSPLVTIELYNSSGSSNNWAYILRGLPLQSSGRLLKVDRLILTNVQFNVKRSNGKSVDVAPIPYLEFKDLGSMSTADLSRIVFYSTLEMASKESALSKILNDVMPLSKSLMPQKRITTGSIEPEVSEKSYWDELEWLKEHFFKGNAD